MNRKDAMEIILKSFKNSPIVSANGFISRDLFNVNDKKSNFYMIGSMGLASSIGLGIALKNPKKSVLVFDGDGNILMNLGSITTIGTQKPKNLIHVIFDNSIHDSTGGQPTNSKYVKIKKLGVASNYQVFSISTKNKLESILKKIKYVDGPVMLVINIEKNNDIGKRVNIEPIEIRNRFMRYLKQIKN
tara:strand:- start:2836 stop:3399 length:564 start_codon:yes stop_codon:yes gene_type:complete